MTHDRTRSTSIDPTRMTRLAVLIGPLASEVSRVDSILLVAQVVVRHNERKQNRQDGDACRRYAQNFHRVVVRYRDNRGEQTESQSA